jgi:glycosyltransferase involved in cell wall biosynthesis
MRILLVHNYYQLRGGEDVYIDSLYKLLKENGHDVFLYTKRSSDIKSNLISKASIALGMFYNKSVEKELTKIIKSFRPDIAHFHNIYPLITPVAYRICKKFSVPIIQTVHSYRFMCPKATLFRNGKICEECVGKKLFYPAIKYGCYRQSRLQSTIFSLSAYYYNLEKQINMIDKFIFPAKFTRDYYVKHLQIPIEKTEIIPHFVDIKTTENKINHKKNYFLFVGRFSEEKGILPLLKVFSELSNIKLIVIGNGPLKKQVLSYTKYKNINILTSITRRQIFKYMRNALATIISSQYYEVGPMVLYESYANQTPVIAPDIGVFKEKIINGKTGYLFNFSDFNNLKKKLKYFQKRSKDLKKIKSFVIKHYSKKFSQTIHLNKLQKLFIELKN